MQQSYTEKELLDQGFYNFYQNILIHPKALLPFDGSEKALLEHCIDKRKPINERKDRSQVDPALPIFKYCTYYKAYFHINEFGPAKTNGVYNKFTSLSLKGDTERSTKLNKEYFARNLPYVRFFFNGNMNETLKCAISGKVLENVAFPNYTTNETTYKNQFDLHHMNTVNGKSVHKMSKKSWDPSKILVDKDITNVANHAFLIDVMGTVCIDQNSHFAIHVHRNSDIKHWRHINALPWALKNVLNFKEFCKLTELDLDYDKFMFAHTLEWYDKYSHLVADIDFKIKNKEYITTSLEAYINRFKI